MFFVSTSVDAQGEKYAFLISFGQARMDSSVLHSEYWYDLVDAYEDLLDQGYTNDKIIVFYGSGKDFDSKDPNYNIKNKGWQLPITDYDNSIYSLNNVFEYMANQIHNEDDILIRLIMGHGSNYVYGNPDKYSTWIENRDNYIDKAGIIKLINKINKYKIRIVYWSTCYSGCLVKGDLNLNNNKTIVITDSDFDEVSYSTIINRIPKGEFNYAIKSATKKDNPVMDEENIDYNKDGKIDYSELYYFFYHSYFMKSNVQMSDSGNIAKKIYLK